MATVGTPICRARSTAASRALHLKLVVLDFDEILIAENFLVPGNYLSGFFHVRLAAGEDQPVKLAGNAAAEANQALFVGL